MEALRFIGTIKYVRSVSATLERMLLEILGVVVNL